MMVDTTMQPGPRTADDMEAALHSLVDYDAPNLLAEDALFDSLVSVSTFAEAGILTRDKGLVLRLDNGAEFQITIVQSAAARAT